MAGISRREFMGGAAAAAAAAALPVVRTEPARAGVSGAVCGITVNKGAYGVSSYLTAAKIADGYVGLPLAVTFEKVYMGHGQFTMPEKVAELKPAGQVFDLDKAVYHQDGGPAEGTGQVAGNAEAEGCEVQVRFVFGAE